MKVFNPFVTSPSAEEVYASDEAIARARAAALRKLDRATGMQNIQHPWQGVAQMTEAAMGGLQTQFANAQEERKQRALAEALTSYLGGGDASGAAGAPVQPAGGGAPAPGAAAGNPGMPSRANPQVLARVMAIDKGVGASLIERELQREEARLRAQREEAARRAQWDREDKIRAEDKARPATAEELKAYGLPPGTSAQIDGKNRLTVINNSSADWEKGPIGRDEYGNEIQGWYNKKTQEVKPLTAPPQGGAQASAPADGAAPAFPPPPPGVDLKRYRELMTEKMVNGDKAPTTLKMTMPDNSEVSLQWNPKTREWDPIKASGPGTSGTGFAPKLTEQQSKDLVYFDRGKSANDLLAPIDGALTNFAESAASGIPMVGNYMVSKDYRLAQQAGANFLASILRKDSGAALTNSDNEIYGRIFLPRPGDDPDTLAQKRQAREDALDAVKRGLGPAEILSRYSSRGAQPAPGGQPAQPAAQPPAPAAQPFVAPPGTPMPAQPVPAPAPATPAQSDMRAPPATPQAPRTPSVSGTHGGRGAAPPPKRWERNGIVIEEIR